MSADLEYVLLIILLLFVVSLIGVGAWVSTYVHPSWIPQNIWFIQLDPPDRRVVEVYTMQFEERPPQTSRVVNVPTPGSDPSVTSINGASGDGTLITLPDIRSPESSAAPTAGASTESFSGGSSGRSSTSDHGCSVTSPSSQSGDDATGGGQDSDNGSDEVLERCTQPEVPESLVEACGLEDPHTCNDESQETEDKIKIKLKFLDDTFRPVSAALQQTVGEFRRQEFPIETADGKVIRLIFQGQLLRDDERSLESYGLKDGCAVHCHISSTPYAARPGAGAPELYEPSAPASRGHHLGVGGPSTLPPHHGLELGQHMHLIFALKFMFLWIGWLYHPEYFNATSFVSLILGSTVYMMIMYVTRWRGRQNRVG